MGPINTLYIDIKRPSNALINNEYPVVWCFAEGVYTSLDATKIQLGGY